ncbi:MAG: ATP-dependent zinc metalloprotease FtsH [Phycisphaerae bacterium]|nr:ATP-dependent zinc metalloprotease FtsH [Phycisphaerae bacterium]
MSDLKNEQNESRPGGSRPQPPRMRMSRGVVSWIGFILIALMILALINDGFKSPKRLLISEFWDQVESGNIQRVVLRDNSITGYLKESRQGRPVSSGPERFEVKYPPAALQQELIDKLLAKAAEHHFEVEYDETSGLYVQLLVSIVPWLMIILFIWFFVFRQLRTTAGGAGMLGSFGRSRHRVSNKESATVTFADVAGIEEAKEEVREIVEFLKNPKKFQRLGGRIPHGVLLVGDPGCGKTLLAKAIAGEADVPFFSISGADFVEMFVGVGASRVRDLFKQAKENAPCIIFLDEIDAVGRRRGAGYNGGGHDEREQTLNAILVEMDGFDTSDQVIVIAATNREDVLDAALTRPGRFDRRVFVPLPDIRGRLEILKVHARKIKLRPGVDLMQLARGTPMFSGAELAAIINEAALIATLTGKEAVDIADLEEARDKVRWGRANKSRKLAEKERLITAYHEAGHAALMFLLPDSDPLHKVSIIPRGPALGTTFQLPETDRYTMSRRQAMATLQVLFGGRIAEEMFCNDVTSGAASDIQRATQLARTMICDWGMSDSLGPVRYGVDESRRGGALIELPGAEYSEKTAEQIDTEVRKLVDEAIVGARTLMEQHRDKIEALAQALLRHETLDRSDVERIFRGEPLDKVTLSGLIEGESVPTRRSEPTAATAPEPTPDLPGTLPQPGMG